MPSMKAAWVRKTKKKEALNISLVMSCSACIVINWHRMIAHANMHNEAGSNNVNTRVWVNAANVHLVLVCCLLITQSFRLVLVKPKQTFENCFQGYRFIGHACCTFPIPIYFLIISRYLNIWPKLVSLGWYTNKVI